MYASRPMRIFTKLNWSTCSSLKKRIKYDFVSIYNNCFDDNYNYL